MNTASRFPLSIPLWMWEQMLQHAREELPNECCGLLCGPANEGDSPVVASHRFALKNHLASAVEFESDPKEMFAAMREIDRLELRVLAVYHSHPSSAPLPSRKDLDRSYGPNVMNLILGMAAEPPEVRAWWYPEEGGCQIAKVVME